MTVFDPRYKEHCLNVGIEQRTREMIRAAIDTENPLGDGEQSSAKRTGLSVPDEGPGPSLSHAYNWHNHFFQCFSDFGFQPWFPHFWFSVLGKKKIFFWCIIIVRTLTYDYLI